MSLIGEKVKFTYPPNSNSYKVGKIVDKFQGITKGRQAVSPRPSDKEILNYRFVVDFYLIEIGDSLVKTECENVFEIIKE